MAYALVWPKSDDPSARSIAPIVGVLTGSEAHKAPVSLTAWSSASVPSLLVRNRNTSGASLIAYSANGSVEILKALNTGVVFGGAVTATGLVTLDGNLVANGNVTLGNASGDALTVNATSTFVAAATFDNALVANAAFLANGAVTLGNAAGDAVVINGTSSFLAPATFSSTLSTESTTTLGNAITDATIVSGTLSVAGASTLAGVAAGATTVTTLNASGAVAFDSTVALGNAAGDAISVVGTATFTQTPLFSASIDVQGGTAGQIRAGAVIVAAASLDGTEELLVNGQSRLKGAVTVTTGGIDVTGSSVFASGFTVTTGGITVTAGGLTLTAAPLIIGSSPATTGSIRGLNALSIYALNNAGTGNLRLIESNNSDDLYIGTSNLTNAINVFANGAVSIGIGATTRIVMTSSGLGFFGASATGKPTVTGSRGGNAALADLLTELATLGLITDSSSA